ncbi:unnamed protein product [Onchocerca flexuosa]|uniref:Rab-GAP TBC domain-containing protein n=1 Tax=Onchocerca flexuosa TaxID=387005 RepID=A0A183HPR6_9BILA|nr:unnamed protein product [Onchocerca flexuosa]
MLLHHFIISNHFTPIDFHFWYLIKCNDQRLILFLLILDAQMVDHRLELVSICVALVDIFVHRVTSAVHQMIMEELSVVLLDQ